MKTAIQMTMFHVANYGAALQTYALQRFIDGEKGWKCRTLNLEPCWDGVWSFGAVKFRLPKRYIKRPLFRRLLRAPVAALARARRCFLQKKYGKSWVAMFAEFRRREVHLTKRYNSRLELLKNPPSADLYITGSDQTFNPRFTGADSTWFFDFLSKKQKVDSRKISYASSFGGGDLPEGCEDAFRDGLSGYHALSVRESGGVSIVAGLGLHACHCCDPTMLLSREDWARFAAKSERKVDTPYILSFNLRYAVDPVPSNGIVERQVSEKLNLPIIHLYEWPMDKFTKTGRVVRDADLYDFVKLFLNASFVLTSSFHGVVFSLISGAPFIAYVNSNHGKDCRAYDLLSKCRADRHALEVPCENVNISDLGRFKITPSEREAFDRFRNDSASWLRGQMDSGVTQA